MVQFALKLEDNRVEKWASHYVDYRKLKQDINKVIKSIGKAPTRNEENGGSPDTRWSPHASPTTTPATENTGLLSSTSAAVNNENRGVDVPDMVLLAIFHNSITREIDNVERFFVRKIEVLRNDLANLDPSVPILAVLDEWEQAAAAAAAAAEAGGRVGQQSDAGDIPGGMVGGQDDDTLAPRVMEAKPARSKKEEDSLRRALLALYRDLMLLQNFAIVNYTAVVQIMRKVDKRMMTLPSGGLEQLHPLQRLKNQVLEYAHQQDFYRKIKLTVTVTACEAYFAGVFCGGNMAQARGLMLPQKTDEKIDLFQFQLGYRMGIAAVLAFWIIWDCCFEPYEIHSKRAIESGEFPDIYLSVLLQPAFPVYRAVAGILLLRWCWGLSSLVWGRTRINYIYLFDMDPRAVSSPLEVFNDVAAETVVYLANLLIYYKLLLHRFPPIIPPGCLSLLLCLYVTVRIIYPFRKAWEFWRVIFRVLVAPLVKVEFFATYVADVMTSFVKTTQDLAWTACFFLSGDFLLDLNHYHTRGGSWQKSAVYMNLVIPGLCILPLWLRFQQCLRRYHDTQKRSPHLANCLKYSMAFTVALFGVFSPPNSTTTAVKVVWFTMYVVSTLYTFAWDVFQDWGLGQPHYQGLRKRRLFSKSTVYYAAIVADLVLRFNWLYSLIPPGHNPLPFIHSDTMPVFVTTVVTVCELLRRTMWGFFRLENEQICNTEGYRATDHVPLHFTTETVRQNGPRQKGVKVMGEVLAVTLAGVAMAAAAIVAARDQAGIDP